ncbi:MAG: hypothetical protein JXR19_01745 [Bacteroidia bacterium]
MTPREFIQNVIINEQYDIVTRHPYLSFGFMSISIEFLGKCFLVTEDWHKIKPAKAFKKGVQLLEAIDRRYGDIPLKDLRDGFAHTLHPKHFILSEIKNGSEHLSKTSSNRIILVAEELFRDIVKAGIYVIEHDFGENHLVDESFLRTGPDHSF